MFFLIIHIFFKKILDIFAKKLNSIIEYIAKKRRKKIFANISNLLCIG